MERPVAPESPPDDALTLEAVSHGFGAVRALDDVSLAVRAGEVLCLVGPSGCGKTTLLRLAAGLEAIQEGRVHIGAHMVACADLDVAPERRGVGMVFQDYALFPHLTVTENVAFGLHRLALAERRTRTRESLVQFGIAELADAYPHTLSGGEQQRVALARALAPKPHLVLLDEPFSGLDSRLRDRVRDETLHALKASGAATLMVTHDPEEAMFMADRIALMRAGRIEQIGRPVALYFQPATAFAAAFFSDMNRLEGVVRDGRVSTPFGALETRLAEGTPVEVLIRPEALHLAWAPDEEQTEKHYRTVARVLAARLLGRSTLIHLDLSQHSGAAHLHLHSRVPKHVAFGEGDEVAVTLDVSQAFVFARTDAATDHARGSWFRGLRAARGRGRHPG